MKSDKVKKGLGIRRGKQYKQVNKHTMSKVKFKSVHVSPGD